MHKIPLIGTILAIFLCYQCADSSADQIKEAAKNSLETAMTGEELAKIHCGSCHKYPSPELLDKSTWGNFVLLRMAAFMGIYHDNVKYLDKMPAQWIEPGVGGQRVAAANIYPKEPLISREDWEKIRDFYLKNAPMKLASASAKTDIKVGIPNFEVAEFNKSKEVPPLVQAIAIDEATNSVYAGVYKDGIYKMNGQGKLVDKTVGTSFFVDFEMGKNKFIALDMATRYATDNPAGKLLIANSFKSFKQKKFNGNLPKLMRPVSFETGDLDGDGIEDYLVSEYGNYLGQLAWYGSKDSKNSFEQHILFADDGAIKAKILDLNQDGKNDILALQGNGNEGVDRYLNQGNGEFKRERILRFLPTNGSTDFQIIDFDGDGKQDILYTNGDNGDYTPILKPHHGIRLFLNKNEEYKEAFFIPLNGVYQAEAVDFDKDGDLDIAAVSFHPDFKNHPQESFVFYENDGQNNFSAYTIPQFADSRWMRFTTGDVDADGDVDILLSAMNIKTPEIGEATADKWAKEETAILILRNQKR
ncbi:MAG: hypothetical protein ACI9XO_002965 [Paraglaciecola sp.]|jgi:hypothetical protein